jgi:predicted metal-dependent hydrolase
MGVTFLYPSRVETPAPVASVVAEVRGFLSDLRAQWPELFGRRSAAPATTTPRPRGEIETLIHERVAHWAPIIGVTYGRVSVKDQRSLWGSCSRDGNLNFTWRLTLAPREVLDYVVVHELAHRLELNHSPRFWSHVAAHCPDYRVHRRWLKDNSDALHRTPRPTA